MIDNRVCYSTHTWGKPGADGSKVCLGCGAVNLMGVRDRTSREEQLEELVISFVLEMSDYMIINKLGDPEQKHNIKWARKLGIHNKLPSSNHTDAR